MKPFAYNKIPELRTCVDEMKSGSRYVNSLFLGILVKKPTLKLNSVYCFLFPKLVSVGFAPINTSIRRRKIENIIQ